MNITINNCNCIDVANITLEEGKLNIKYAMNGTGKSTISKAIALSAKGEKSLLELTPFKYVGTTDEALLPSVTGAETIKLVSIFNEDYINQFVLKPDEVVANSFEIFVKTPQYDQQMADIEKSYLEIKETFKSNEELEQVIKDLNELSDCFGKSKNGYSEAGALHKGIGKGNKIENIPIGLESYKAFLQNNSNVKWLKWQIGGNEFLDISTECPYCTSSTKEKKEQILAVTKEYDSKSIEHLNKILNVIEHLSKYFSVETNENLQKITKNKTAISVEEINYLKVIKGEIDIFRGKLLSLKNMSFYSFADVTKVIDKIDELKIKVEYLPDLDSLETRKIVDAINASLDIVLAKAGQLQGAINIQKGIIKKTIEANNDEINTFLKYAGYKYLVDIEANGETYKMRLKHPECNGAIENGAQHLSYGEKNAFSLVLFMYQAIAENPDLVVLDDPISSFDRNKKFAILDTLFRKTRSLKNKTVLLMTHDFEPIIDMVHNFHDKFQKPSASFLESKNGIVNEIAITKNDVVTFSKICQEHVASECNNAIKIIYLRRHFEVADEKKHAYQLLSNLLHRRPVPQWIEYGSDPRVMTTEEISIATASIRERIQGFNYTNMLNDICDDGFMKNLYVSASNNYEKLQIFRIIKNGKDLHKSDVICKYINEAFHIENEYLMQLSPSKYEITPKFIIDECDKVILA